MSATKIEKLTEFGGLVESRMSRLVGEGINEAELVAVLCRLIQYKCLHTDNPAKTHESVLEYMRQSWDSSKDTLAEVKTILSNESN